MKKYHANTAILFAICILDLIFYIERDPTGVSNNHCLLSSFFNIFFVCLMP